jgi:hypothetical protein
MTVFQPITKEDIDLVRTLQPQDWPDIIPHFITYIHSPICYPFKFSDNGVVTGSGVLIHHGDTAWLAHIIVHQEHRKKGIGSFIVETLLQQAEKLSVQTKLLIATALGEPVYLKAGFRSVSTYRFFKKEAPLTNSSVCEDIIDLEDKFISQVYELDKLVSGEDRRATIGNYLSQAKVFVKKGEVKGFYLPLLGEGLIIAKDKTAGLELMALKHSTINKAVLPEENVTGIKFLKDNGFVEFSQGRRMIYGADIPWKPECFFSRIGGNLG